MRASNSVKIMASKSSAYLFAVVPLVEIVLLDARDLQDLAWTQTPLQVLLAATFGARRRRRNLAHHLTPRPLLGLLLLLLLLHVR